MIRATQGQESIVEQRVDGERQWTRKHLLDVDDLSRDEIELLMETTEAMKEVLGREVPRVPVLRGRTVVTLFYEASTRTRASFELAGKALGADVINVSAGGSSVEKGESLIDTVRTLQAVGADVLVMRHGSSGAPYIVARQVRSSVISAGDGWHAHPTQALLDLFTMRSHLGDVRGRKVVIVGDIAHSRVARSNIWLLSNAGAEVTVCAPPTLLPAGMRPSDVLDETLGMPRVTVETDLDVAVRGADVVMALRLQQERMTSGLLPSLREYATLYQLNERRVALANTGALVMHPGPMNEGVEISPAVASSLQSVIEEQVTNGVAVRMAVLLLMCRGKNA
ncbi:MAG: aspartate carbamoyltransferase catalytic subunit [Dehalococcoidia bacterium]